MTTCKGECFCGAVAVEATGEPEGMGYCHCSSCRSWSAGPVNAFTLWKPEAVKVTRGAAAAGTRLATPAFSAFMNEKNFDIVEKLEAFVKARGHSMLKLAFSWLAARPTVASIIAGATKPEQIEANAKAVSWELTSEEMKEIDELTKKD